MDMGTVQIMFAGIALVFTAIQILLLVLQMKETLKWNKLNATFECIDEITGKFSKFDPVLLDKIGILRYDDNVLTTEEFKKLLENETYRLQLFEIAHNYEKFSIAVLSKFINEKIAKRLYFKNITNGYRKLRPYILIRNEESTIDILQHFQKVAYKWERAGVNTFKPGEY